MIDRYLDELARALRVRGRLRRRFVAECRDHLHDLADERGPAGAVAAFGDAAVVARDFDLAVARRRDRRATWLTVVAVAAVGASTLALIRDAAPGAHGSAAVAVVFFVAAQVAAVAAALAGLQLLTGARATAGDLALLRRRNATALAAAAVTMLAAGVALPGTGSPLPLLAGPAVWCLAAVTIARGRGLTAGAPWVDRAPPHVGVVPVALLAGVAAFWRDHGEAGATVGGSLTVAAIELLAVLVAFAVLRGPLGLRTVGMLGRR